MNFRTTIVLIVLLAAVGIYLLFARTSEETEVKPSADANALLALKSEDVSRVSITPAGEKKVVIEKTDDGKWRIVEPVQADADRYETDSLVSSLTALSTRGKVSLADAGVESPRYTVEIAGKDGKAHTLSVGERSAVGDHMYVRLDGADQADVVSADVYDSLENPLKKYRETKLVDVSSNDIHQICIDDKSGQDVVLEKPRSDWRLPNLDLPADSSAASDLTFALTGLNATEFVSDPSQSPADFGLDRPVLSVWFSTQAPATQPSSAAAAAPAASQPAGTTIRFGRYDDILKKNVYVSIDDGKPTPTIAKVPASALDSFRKSPLDLRDKTVFDVDPANVTSIAIHADLPATTQPTTRPAINRDVAIQRQPEEIVVGPQFASSESAAATTQPAAATQPTTEPAPATTAPAKPKWIFSTAATAGQKVDESKVDSLLSALNPLKAEKFLAQAPATQPAGTYVLKVTDSHDGRTWELNVIDPGDSQPLIGSYQQWRFELDRSLLNKLEGDFATQETASSSSSSAESAAESP